LSRAGKANEVGSVFRCVVATHLAVHGLRGRPVSGLDLPAGVFPVRLDFETDDPTDDIRVTFSTGRRAYVSAKRKVSKGSPLKETIDGWVKQTPTLGPDGLLAIAGEEFVGPAKHLARALRRHRKGLPMESESERTALSVIDNLLPATVRDIVLDRARVLRLQGSTDSESFKDFLAALMDHVVDGEQGPQAVDVLSALLHRQAGQALGSGIDDWVAALNGAGLKVIADQGARREDVPLPNSQRSVPTGIDCRRMRGGSIFRCWPRIFLLLSSKISSTDFGSRSRGSVVLIAC
jgi:hypothetical protein